MKCGKPYIHKEGGAFPCGQCLPCRLNKRRIWTHRIMLEMRISIAASFVTLTYSDENLPRMNAEGLPTLWPAHLRDFLKRLRKALAPARVRFFAVGEYGDSTQRPHYHLAVFGLPPCVRGSSRFSKNTNSCCPTCDLIRDKWGMGNVIVGTLTNESAQYVAGYVVKKMTAPDDMRLNGRHPEFARMSLRPGIGVAAMDEVASTMLALDLETTETDVPVSLRHGPKQLPLGRTLRRKLRERIGREANAPQAALDAIKEELRPVREVAFNNSTSFKEAIIELNRGHVARLEGKERLYSKRKHKL